MNLPDLLHSLTIAGLKMKLGPDDAIDIIGRIEKLTDEQRQGVRQNKSQIKQLLGCFTESEEEAESAAIANLPTPKRPSFRRSKSATTLS